jgi:hypothetical protein
MVMEGYILNVTHDQEFPSKLSFSLIMKHVFICAKLRLIVMICEKAVIHFLHHVITQTFAGKWSTYKVKL